MNVICIGSASKDIFFPTREGEIQGEAGNQKIIFKLGDKYHIDNRFESLGGCAANQAVGLSRLGVSASCYSSVGSDEIGRWMMEEFKKEKVNTNLIEIEPDCPSGLSAIVVAEKNGERIIFSNQEANERLRVNPERLVEASLVSITDLSDDWKTALGKALNYCQKNGIKSALNPRRINIEEDSRGVLEFSRLVDIFFVNKDEARELLEKAGIDINDKNEDFLAGKIQEFGAKIVAVTDGERGAWISSEGKTFHAEAIKENAIDSTGAGDAFASGFLAAFIQGNNLEECAKWGIVNGGNVVNFYGGTKGLLSGEEIIEQAKKVQIENL